MITPVNNHLLIEPLPHDSFIATKQDTYEEIGTVVATPEALLLSFPVKQGDKVYFDSWMAAKYPKETDGYYWLVKWEDVRAIEYA